MPLFGLLFSSSKIFIFHSGRYLKVRSSSSDTYCWWHVAISLKLFFFPVRFSQHNSQNCKEMIKTNSHQPHLEQYQLDLFPQWISLQGSVTNAIYAIIISFIWVIRHESGIWLKNLIPGHWHIGFDQQYHCHNSWLCLQGEIHRLQIFVMTLEQLQIFFLCHLWRSWRIDSHHQTRKTMKLIYLVQAIVNLSQQQTTVVSYS